MSECFPVMTEEETAKMLRCSLNTLIKMRKDGSGPPSIKIKSRHKYLKESVLKWLKEIENQEVEPEEDCPLSEEPLFPG